MKANDLNEWCIWKKEEAELMQQVATDIWLNKINKSHSIKILPNTPKDNRNGYGMKEYYYADDGNLKNLSDPDRKRKETSLPVRVGDHHQKHLHVYVPILHSPNFHSQNSCIDHHLIWKK